MKIKISKIDAAKSQLIEAINLFFEERDPVSIHTLAAASLQILYDHFDDVGKVWDHNLMFHYNAIHIKDEYRGEWIALINEPKNFFKHADKDLKNGKTEIEFWPNVNHFYIMEAIRCLRIIEKDNHVWEPEFRVFTAWYVKKYPHHLKDGEGHKMAENLSFDSYKSFRDVLVLLKENPEFFGIGK